MLVIKQEPTFETKVRVQDPTTGPGRKVVHEFTATFMVKPPEFTQECADAAMRARAAGEVKEDAVFLLSEVLVGWSGVKEGDRDGPDFPFSDENRKVLMSLPYVRVALVEAYLEGISGKARRGN